MKKLFLLLALAFAAMPAFGQDLGPKVQARLVSEQGAVAPGGTVTVALEERIVEGWHTYWKNPGDAGAPTQVTWTLPPGWTAGDIQWPRPKRLPVGPLMDYGYEGKVWLLSKLTAPSDARPGETVTIRAAASWLGRYPSSPAGGAFLVAPPDPHGPAFPRRAAATFTELSAQPLPCPALVVGSTTDPYCTAEAAAEFATRWAARWHLAGAYGHLNSASELGAWQQGRELLDSLTRQWCA